MPKKGISETTVENLRVLMRVDFNVPLDGRRITDDRRIMESLESIRSFIDRGGKLILASHLGRPKGQVRPELSLRPIAEHLSTLLARLVAFADQCTGPIAERATAELKPGDGSEATDPPSHSRCTGRTGATKCPRRGSVRPRSRTFGC